jgi:UDP-GlcNAc:undecaprenyl-phosphate GlcNAc-1-phosphate transferase
MTLELVVTFVLPIVLSICATPWVIRLAHMVGAIDQPDARKVHTRPIPRLGGVAVSVSFGLSLVVSAVVFPEFFKHLWVMQYHWMVLAISLILVLSVGIYDDVFSLSAMRKLLFQIVAGTLVYLAGLQIHTLSVPFGKGILLDVGPLAYLITVMWVVGITNAFNLIDGLDGLASGITIIASMTIFIIAQLTNDAGTATLALMLVGSVLGFLPFNFNPARIFLGDSGSLVLGFLLAILSIHSSTKGSTAFSITTAMLALGLPIMDTLLTMTRRFLRSFLPSSPSGVRSIGHLRSILLPDKSHIHHQLLARGFSHRGAVVFMYLLSSTFGICAFAATTRTINTSLMLGMVGVAIVIGIRMLGYKEMALLGNGVLLPMYDRPLMRRGMFHFCLDLISVVAAFCVTYFIVLSPPGGSPNLEESVRALIAVCTVQIVVLSIGGVYKGVFQTTGIGDVLRAIKAVASGVCLSGLLLSGIAGGSVVLHSVPFWILDFYFLATGVVGIRVSFQVLKYLGRIQSRTGRHVLIYGANTGGLLTLQRILASNGNTLAPVGFLDENPQLEGKVINGYRVYGGHWKLAGLLKKIDIDEIILSIEEMRPEVMRRLRQIAGEHGVTIRSAKAQFEDPPAMMERMMEPPSINTSRQASDSVHLPGAIEPHSIIASA